MLHRCSAEHRAATRLDLIDGSSAGEHAPNEQVPKPGEVRDTVVTGIASGPRITMARVWA